MYIKFEDFRKESDLFALINSIGLFNDGAISFAKLLDDMEGLGFNCNGHNLLSRCRVLVCVVDGLRMVLVSDDHYLHSWPL